MLPKPSEIGNLDTTYTLENCFSAFISEPRDLVPFETAWHWQSSWQKKLLNQPHSPQRIWLLQHQNCYTIGRGSNYANLRFDHLDPPYALHRIDRGGEVTFHCPGQLVAYPIIDLRLYKTDLHWYLRQLEEVLIDVLGELGLVGDRIDGLTGIWIDGVKVASIGVGCRRWITQHGLALNVDCDLSGFRQIIPCGIKDRSIGSLTSWLPGLSVKDVQPLMRHSLKNRFQLTVLDQLSN